MFAIFSLFLWATASRAAVVPNGYAPFYTTCPNTPLVRAATSLSTSEAAYFNARKPIADAALASFLQKTNTGFGTADLPAVALATSGGGLRSLLNGGGVVKGFDSRDSNGGTAGIWQALTYHAGDSGSAWLVASIAGNNYPTVTSLQNGLWTNAFEYSLFLPGALVAAPAYASIVADIAAKEAAGYPPTLVDVYARALSYSFLYGTDGGVGIRLSSIASLPQFTSHSVPYPIMTSLGVLSFNGECLPGLNATQYELTPYEFGSWDPGVSAFSPMQYLGSIVNNGMPSYSNKSCTENFDNLGFTFGCSSNLFNALLCTYIPPVAGVNDTFKLIDELATIVQKTHALSLRDEYAIIPNPFRGYARSTSISAQAELTLADGGETNHSDPVIPFLQPERNVNVLILNDNSANINNLPDGRDLILSYNQSVLLGLSKMPFIPPLDTFAAEGLAKRPVFFGCNDSSKLTIIYLPLVDYVYAANTSTYQFEYSPSATAGLINNGVAIATNNGSSTWPTCLACGIMMKTGQALPTACTACFSQFCYYH